MRLIYRLALVLSLLSFLGACGGDEKKPKAPVKQAKKTPPAPQPQTDPGPTDAASKNSANLGEVIYFAFDSSDLSPESRVVLEQNATWMRDDKVRTLTIEGHTDEVGTPEYNLALGERRAQATKDYLVHLGIEANRIAIITYGEERPVSKEDALNRRSVFVATKK
jgi:peptidoglycan-associated lipoprotein